MPLEHELAVALMRRHAAALTDDTLRRNPALAHLSREERVLVEAITRDVVAAFLGEPTARLQREAATERGVVYLRAVRHLFCGDDLREPAAA